MTQGILKITEFTETLETEDNYFHSANKRWFKSSQKQLRRNVVSVDLKILRT